MDRRSMLGVLAASATGLAVAGGAEAGTGHEHDGHLKTLSDCAMLCNEAARHCLDALTKASAHAEHHAKSHEATIACQSFCTLTGALMARGSSMATYAHRACADACRDCAAACEGQPDEIMKECAKACLDCEKVCRQMMSASR